MPEICPECEYVEPPYVPPFPGCQAVPRSGMVHRGDCPKVSLSREAKQRIFEFGEEVRQCRRRAYEASITYVLGGSS